MSFPSNQNPIADSVKNHFVLSILKVGFPNSTHVQSVGLSKALDLEIWNYAKENNLTIVSKDADFA